jgi:uncharacterized protein YdhG (YjbR/CyaY superfamily)
MLSVREIQQFLSYAPPEQADIVFELRNLIFEVAPDATEVIRTRTRTLSYYFSANQGGPVSASICGISLKDDHVLLYFPHGAFIPDQQGLLTGSGKAMRHIVLRVYDTVPWDAVKVLIREHADFDPRSYLFLE